MIVNLIYGRSFVSTDNDFMVIEEKVSALSSECNFVNMEYGYDIKLVKICYQEKWLRRR